MNLSASTPQSVDAGLLRLNMIGDHAGILKTVNYLKVFSGFYMVYLHGLTMFALLLPWVNYGQFDWGTKGMSVFRVIFTTLLPAYAGFHTRESVGPYLQDHRLPSSFIKSGFQFFVLAIFLEAIRLVGITLDPFHIFAWSALHFIALARITTFAVLSVNSRLLLPLTLAFIFFYEPISRALAFYPIGVTQLTDSIILNTSWVWAILAGLCGMILWQKFGALITKQRKNPWFVLWTLCGLALMSLVVVWVQPLVTHHHRPLMNLYNLPSSIFVTNSFDDNYWPLILCFPLFASGYFFREFSFNLSNRRYESLLLATAAVGVLYLIWVIIPENHFAPQATFDKSQFMTLKGLFSFLSAFLFLFVIIYRIVRNRTFHFMERWSYYSRNLVMLYLVHGLVLRSAVLFFPVHFSERLKDSPYLTSLLIWPFIVGSYLISLALAHRLNLGLERLSRRKGFAPYAN